MRTPKVLHLKTWISALNDIANTLLPPLCFGCAAPLRRGEDILCTHCRHELPLTGYNFSEENPVDRIFYGRVPIKKAAAFVFFSKQGIAQQLLHHLKYKNQEHLGGFLGEWCGTSLKEDKALQNVDAVIPVPLHPKKQKQRGYNQVALFAQKIAAALHTQYREDVLTRAIYTKTQTKKDKQQRWENAKVAFQYNPKAHLEGKHLLLVDDVITTGATMEACAHTLLQGKNIHISVLSIAVVPLQ